MKIKRKKVFKGKIFSVEEIRGRFGKKQIEADIIIFPKTVAILPLIGRDKIVLIKQYRLPARKELWEIPAGKLEKGEGPVAGARRELKEETGFSSGKMEKLAEFYPSPGYLTEYTYLFRTEVLKSGRQSLDSDELINRVEVFRIEEVLEMIKKKKIIDAKTILATAWHIK